MPEYKFGWKKDKHDARDLSLEDHFTKPGLKIPSSVDFRDKVVEVLDQGQTSSCVAHATAQALRTALIQEGVAHPALPSRRWIYWEARRQDGEETKDEGTQVRNAFQACTLLGFCPEDDFPWDPHQINQGPEVEQYRDAYDQKVDGYYRITATGDARKDSIQQALAKGHPVVFGTTVDARIFDITTLDPYDYQGPAVGGHALCLVGYDQDGALVCNSWGPNWGVKGFFKIGWPTLTGPEADDFWVLYVIKDFSA